MGGATDPPQCYILRMLKIIKAISRFLSTYTSLVVIGAAVVAFFLPVAFGWVHGDTPFIKLSI